MPGRYPAPLSGSIGMALRRADHPLVFGLSSLRRDLHHGAERSSVEQEHDEGYLILELMSSMLKMF